MTHDFSTEFKAHVTVSIAGPVAMTDVDCDIVRADYIDAPEDWMPASGIELHPGHYIVTGEYHYDALSNGWAGSILENGNPHHATAEYKKAKWENIS